MGQLLRYSHRLSNLLLNRSHPRCRTTRSVQTPNMSEIKRILIVGGCYAGLAAATGLLDLSEGRSTRFDPNSPAPSSKYPLEITIVDERDGYYHVIGSPLALAKESFAARAWTRFQDVPGLQHSSIKVVHGSVKKVDVHTKTASILPHQSNVEIQQGYDYLVAASGLRRVWPVVPQALTREGYLTEAKSHIAAVKNAKHGVVVIGGGAVGIEMAAELRLVYPDMRVILIHSRERLLSSEPLPDDFKDETLSLLRGVGVEVLTGKRVNDISTPDQDNDITLLTLSDGSTMSTSCVINAISRSSSTSSYLPDSILDSEGYVKIEPTLHFIASTNDSTGDSFDRYHLAAGDIVAWSGIRRCGAAMHMGIFAAYNIDSHIRHLKQSSSSPTPEYKTLSNHSPMIGLALGSTGIAYSPTEGISSGPEVLQTMFQDNLGFSICWNYMKLGECPTSSAEKDAVHASPVDVAETRLTSQPEATVDGIEKSTTELTLEEWIAEAKSSRSRTCSTSASGPDTGLDQTVSTSPSLSAASGSTLSSESVAEPYTPFDAVGNANVTNFEALESPELKLAALEVNETIEAVRCDEVVSKTKVSPIRIAEGERV